MSFKPVTAAVTAVRAALVLAGVGVAVAVVLELLSRPPPPPNSDGFAHGMAAIIGSILIVSSLGVATLAVAAPALIGARDPLGFNRWQRLGLKIAAGSFGVGLLVVAGFAAVGDPTGGLILLFPFVLGAVVIAGLVVVWRVGEAIIRRASRTG